MNIRHILHTARDAAKTVPAQLTDQKATAVLRTLAGLIRESVEVLLEMNQLDLDRMEPENPLYDRLRLTPERLEAIAQDMEQVASLPSPLGKTLNARTLPNGLHLRQISVPMGVIGIVYEARPNVTFDVAALCLKSGNIAVLKGGSDAENSNRAIMSLIGQALVQHKLPTAYVQLLPSDRSATEELLQASGLVDVVIPRGSQQLIRFVREHAKVPVIETGAGIVHTYFDRSANVEKGKAVLFNAKTRRVSVCNALDCLLLHRDRLADLPTLLAPMAERKVELFADDASYKTLQGHYPERYLHRASPEHYGTEFLDYKLSIRTVKSLDEALEHIHEHSSKHSEAILAEDPATIETFLNQVDAAVVYANASTAFTDGAQFGLGAEIGISTQKLHARGPMALEAMTSYKWVVTGQGQTRNP